MAIASAVLQHLLEVVKCKTLFITHYPLIARELEEKQPTLLQNLHMGFIEDTRVDGTREITFTYNLIPGIASGSFGVECGRLAGIPESVLQAATRGAEEMRFRLETRTGKTR
jgi:DNA mismatch repair protein MSH3